MSRPDSDPPSAQDDAARAGWLSYVGGLTQDQIAAELGISPRTVEIHRTWVMNKMAAKTLADLVRKGLALGLR